MHRPVAPLNDSQGPLEKGREGGLDATTTELGAQVLLKGECPSMSTQRVRGQVPACVKQRMKGHHPGMLGHCVRAWASACGRCTCSTRGCVAQAATHEGPMSQHD